MRAAPHQQSFVSNPLAQLAAAFAGGILVTQVFSFPLLPVLLVAALLSFATFAALLKNQLDLATVTVTIALLLLGVSFAAVEKHSVSSTSLKHLIDAGVILVGDPVELTGVVDRAPEFAPRGVYLTLRVEGISAKGGVRKASGVVALLIPSSAAADGFKELELRYGARLLVMTTLNRSDSFRNPGVSTFTEYLDRKGYDATGLVRSPLLIERLDDERVFLALAWLYEWRRKIQEQIESKFSPQTAGVLNAALLGNRYGLSRETAERFRDGGTFHVLVISGLHISFIGGLVFLVARRITKRRSMQFAMSAALLWSYTFAVGAEVSVVRAAFMFTFVAFAPIVSRRAASLNALGAAASLLLVLRPRDLLDPSFQLTFLSVAAIVLVAWPLLERLATVGSWRPTHDTPHPPAAVPWVRALSETLYWRERKWREELLRSNYSYRLFKIPLAARLERYRLQALLRYTFAAIVVSASVQITLLPLLIIYFHRLSVASIVLNIGVSLLMALLSIVAIFGLIVGLLSATVAAPLISVANGLNWLMVHSVDPFAGLGLASLRLPEYSGWTVSIYVLYYVPLVILALFLSRWNPLDPTIRSNSTRNARWIRRAALAQLFFLLVVVGHPLSAARPDGRMRVDFLDVGQGDAALITMPDGTTVLIDAGGRPVFRKRSEEDREEEFERDTRPIGDAVVSEYLWSRGLDSVDYVLATHADADHIDGFNEVAENFRVHAALAGRRPRSDPEYGIFAQRMDSKGIPINLIGAGDTLCFGSVKATVLWPPPDPADDAPSRNNDSVVLRLQFGERTLLLAGDIESGAEAALLRSREELRADVVKVAHHGSKTSSIERFVGAAHARFAVISVGQTSMFGHPHREVVQRWKASGAEVLTTGNSGTITVSTDGSDLRVDTFVPRKFAVDSLMLH